MKAGRSRDGFTLLELLVAAAIAVVLAALVLMVTDSALRQWRRTQDNFASASEARLVLDQLERDLQSTVALEGAGWLQLMVADSTSGLALRGWTLAGARLRPPADSIRPSAEGTLSSGDSIAAARFGVGGASIKLISVTAESGMERALPRAIGWQIARRPAGRAGATACRYTLYRSAVGAAETFREGYDVGLPAYKSRSPNPAPARAPATLGNPSNADAFARDVVDLGCWFYRREPGGALVRIYPADSGDLEFTAGSPPEIADLMVRILTDEGARRLELLEAMDGARAPGRSGEDGWWTIVQAHSHVFTRRVEFIARR